MALAKIVIVTSACDVVPSAPRDLDLSVTQEDPPVVTLTWQAPNSTHGSVEGYRLTYRAVGVADIPEEERHFGPEKTSFTTGFLGKLVLTAFQQIGESSVFRFLQMPKR